MKKINFKKVFRGRNVVFSLLILAVVFLFGHTASADWAGEVVGGVIGLFIRAVAQILILLVGVLMDVASYSNFINATAVTKGWIVVRDICNMFFVVILLIIAFATILGQEEYGAKKMLPKLIMAAVLINFSKLFCGLMIDIASVVMLTFVNAFSAIGSGNILELLGISKIMQIGANDSVSFSTIVSAYIFGLIYVLIATVVVASMLGMLVMRIVMIWILVVLSPLAFFLQAVPGKGQQYASQWWTKWSSNLIVGPVIAFFLWLSFAALQGDGSPIVASNVDPAVTAAVATASTSPLSEAGTPAQMAKFVIAIGMLLGGMKIAQEVGGETGAALGKGMAQINKGRALAVGAVTGMAVGAAKGTAKLAGRGALGTISVADRVQSGLRGKGYENKTWVGKMAKGWGDDLQVSSKKNRKAAAAKYLGNLGMGEKTAVAGQEVINSKGFQKTANAVKSGLITGGVATVLGAGAPLTLGLAGVASAAGWIAGRDRTNRQERVKNYKNTESDYNQSQAEYEGHENFVKNYEDKDQRFAVLNAKKQSGQTLLTEEKKELKETGDFVNNLDNIKKHDVGEKYLADLNNAAVLQSKKQVVDSGKKQNEKDKNWIKNTAFLDRFSAPKAAMVDMTKEKEAAKKRVESQSMDSEYWLDKNASRCPTTGLRKSDKEELEVLNKGGAVADKATSNIVGSIDRMSGRVAQEWAKAIAVIEEGGTKLGPNLTKIKTGLQGKLTNNISKTTGANYEFNPDSWKGKATANYKAFDETKMDINPGSGGLQYDTFARNSAKNPIDRNAAKDIMGVSFDKINQRANKMGVDYKLDDAAGVNQKVAGPKLKELGTVMSSLIDDEIKALQTTGAAANSREIDQLNVAKSRLKDNNFSGISLKNTDVSYASRQDEYNSTQHEIMHQAGAKDEAMVNASSGALQEAKLYGSVPKSNLESGGKRYDEIIGKMIANMENSGASSEVMSQAISNQINKWQVPNAQRVIETEKGDRETVADIVPDTGKNSEEMFEKTNAAIDKLSDSLSKPIKSFDGGRVGAKTLSTSDQNFFRAMFGGLKKVITKDDKNIGEKLSPLTAIASAAQAEKNNKGKINM